MQLSVLPVINYEILGKLSNLSLLPLLSHMFPVRFLDLSMLPYLRVILPTCNLIFTFALIFAFIILCLFP